MLGVVRPVAIRQALEGFKGPQDAREGDRWDVRRPKYILAAYMASGT
ncbi:hypothetical protein [Actinomadura latina]|uniref:Uncharacterized protein n=1 Tax=Actinomadura latina TaxID=163603 RepID=A0A846YX17_9ACTN|nr:hypothetical protein [Actinomadura latina]NKZ04247.1 hypothetical protein [Actinomadura latina]